MKLGKEFLETVANMNLPKPQTNADRIRAMSDEELAQWLCCHITECSRCDGRHYAGHECEFRNGRSTGLTMWLKSPVEVDNGI